MKFFAGSLRDKTTLHNLLGEKNTVENKINSGEAGNESSSGELTSLASTKSLSKCYFDALYTEMTFFFVHLLYSLDNELLENGLFLMDIPFLSVLHDPDMKCILRKRE